MALLLYCFSCDMLGDVLDVKPERGDLFHLGYYRVIFCLCSLLRCGIGAQNINGKVVNVVHGCLPGTFFQHRLDEGALGSVGPHAPSMRVGRRGSPAHAADGGCGVF